MSAVIPAYNAAEFVGRAIKSVLGQTRPADEIIVVDDGSTDDTAEAVREYAGQVRYIRQDNAGASAARNRGIAEAKGEWIAFLDVDDEWLPENLEVQLGLLARNPDLVWTTGGFLRCLCREERRCESLDTVKGREMLGGKDYFEDYFVALRQHATGCTDTVVVKKRVLEEAELFRVGQPLANDLDMWWRIAYRWGRIGYNPAPLAIYHMDVRGSITHRYKELDIISELVARHLELSAEMGKADEFRPCGVQMVRAYMRAALFDERVTGVRGMMRRFDELLTGRYKAVMWLLTVFPRLTMHCCRALSKISRALHWRREIMRRDD